MCLRSASLLLCLIYVSLRVAQAYDEDKVQNAIKVLDNLSGTRKGLKVLKRVIDGIDEDLTEEQKRSCQVGGGMSHHCAAAFIDSQLNVQDYLKSGMSPGKRNSKDAALAGANSETVSKINDLASKKRGLQMIKRILDQMDSDLIYEQKRTCRVNLGGHCATENAISMSDQLHYLNSPFSPGRKRRDTVLYKKLVQGKLFNQA